MSHLIETMAFVRDTPWHGLGNKLSAGSPIETWLNEAGMDWSIDQSDVLFNVAGDAGMHIRSNSDAKVLYRSDTLAPLSVVSNRYKVVQPSEVMEFYRDLVAAGGFELETAGVLKGGRKLWALARTGQEAMVKAGDNVKAYLLLATSCDGSLATTAQFTSVRVVCNNTLQMAVNDSTGAVKVPHSTVFDPKAVKEALGLGLSHWEAFMANIKAMSQRPVSMAEAAIYFSDLLEEQILDSAAKSPSRAMQQLSALYSGAGMGSLLAGTRGTAWGLLNAVTEYVDHSRRARSQDYRLVRPGRATQAESPGPGTGVAGMTHTPEPWFVSASDHDGVGLLVKPIPGMVITELDVCATMGAEARRIVACVNALAGIPIDVVEAMARQSA